MYTSDTEKNRRGWIRAGRAWFFFSLFLLVFGLIYEHFSFGVISPFMVLAFLVPFLLAALPCAALAAAGRPMPSGPVRALHTAAVWTLSAGCVMTGALEIYGTTNRLTRVYWAAGAVLAAGALTAHILHALCRRAEKKKEENCMERAGA